MGRERQADASSLFSSSPILARMVSFGSPMCSPMRIPLGLSARPVPVRLADSSRTGGELRPSAPKETYALTLPLALMGAQTPMDSRCSSNRSCGRALVRMSDTLQSVAMY